MTIQTLWAPVKREIWEYKAGLIWIPAAVALLLILSVIYMAIAYGFNTSEAPIGNVMTFKSDGQNYEFRDFVQFLALNSEVKDSFISYFTVAASVLMFIPVVLVLLIYGHSSLFDDRKNREVLFWRSMPVSETQNVFTKLFVMGIVAPTIVFVLNLVCLLAILLIDALSFFLIENWQPISLWQGLWQPVYIYGIMLFYFVMLFPLYAWIIFSSAFARKSPFMVSSLIPVLLIAIDSMLRKYFAVDLHIVSGLRRYIDFLDDVTAKHNLAISADIVGSFAVAMLIGGLLLAASIWLRNNRYEI